tara:strand:- start:74838 stop:76139 length:1302 start_codon:yes stop_codon:yes gene_type:complete
MMKKLLVGLLFLGLIVGGYFYFADGEDNSDNDAVTITCGMVGLEHKTCKEGVALWEKKTGKKAKILPAPNGSNERLTIFQQYLAAGDASIDIYQVDVVWPGLLENHLEDLKKYIPQEELDTYIPTLIENNTVNGRLVAMPWFIQVGFMYYRKDLLEKYNRPVPQTWEEMEETAKIIMEGEKKTGNNIWGYVFQGKAYEGLTCNALEMVNSTKDGGTIIDHKGKITLNNSQAAGVINRLSRWIGTIAPEGVLNYEQEDCRGIFQSGKAVFMRNWPYAWPLLNSKDSPVKGKIGIAPLPKGGKDGHHTGVLGGWNLALSKYSKRKEDAADLIRFLTGKEELRRRAIVGGYFPTIESLYNDKDIIAANPLMKIMKKVLKTITARPGGQTGSKYSQVSSVFWNSVHKTLSKNGTAEENFATAAEKLNSLSKNGTKWY